MILWKLVSNTSKNDDTYLPYLDAFTRRFVGLLNQVERARGLLGFGLDLVLAVLYPLGLLRGRTIK